MLGKTFHHGCMWRTRLAVQGKSDNAVSEAFRRVVASDACVEQGKKQCDFPHSTV
jgi:hypothetical protein